MAVHKSLGFLKTTAIGGVIFLFPLIVIGFLVGQIGQVVVDIALTIYNQLPSNLQTPRMIGLLLMVSTAILILLCFTAGMIARFSIGKKLSQTFEKNLLMLFPRYAIFKDQLAGSVGGDIEKPSMKPAIVRFEESSRIGFEVDRTDKGLVSVYFPGAPDPWTGSVFLVPQHRVELLDADFGETVASFEKLGRDSAKLLGTNATSPSHDGVE